MRRWSWVVALLALAATTATGMARLDEDRFPHREHARIFPTCAGCHAGVFEGDSTRLYPEPATCERCHNGRDEERVEWNGKRPEPDNLRFDHLEHAREAGTEMGPDTAACQRCHTAGGAGPRMAVQEAQPPECLSCHEHRAPAHLARETPCAECHVTLVQARELPDSAIAMFPYPPSHERPDFLENHAPETEADLAQCSVCHARESCSRCHVNAGELRAVAQLQPDQRVARLVAGRMGEYPVPASHLDPDFIVEHGEQAEQRIASCANCHAQPSCRSCHIGELGRAQIARLPAAGAQGGAQGVILRGERIDWPRDRTTGTDPDLGPDARRQPPAQGDQATTAHRPVSMRMGPTPGAAAPVRQGGVSEGAVPVRTIAMRSLPQRRDTGRVRGPREVSVHPPGFERAHGAAAASGQLSCEGCHAKKFCSDCHDGEGSRRFHPANFVARHASNAWMRDRECSSCHSTEAFCKDCHQNVGLGASGRLNTAYHSSQPNWLLQHARAARQGMESCTSCHTQRDCMQCHSQAGWSISPHGPNFKAEAMHDRNREMCLKCHFGDPLGR